MELVVGNTYKVVMGSNTHFLKVVDGNRDRYTVKVMESTNWREGSLKSVVKDGVFDNLTWIFVDGIKPRPTKEQTEVELLIEHVKLKFTLAKIHEAIDDALAKGNKAVFIALTNELKKLKKGVVA